MSKKQPIILFATFIVVFILVAGGFIFISRNKQNKALLDSSNSKIIENTTAPKAEQVNEKTYEDESGFTFKYPATLAISDVTPQNESYYTKLELTDTKDKMTISVYDVKFKSLDEWQKDVTNDFRNAKLVGSESLGGISVKQYESVQSGKPVIITAGLDLGVFYLLVSPKDNGFWDSTHARVVETFKLTQDSSPSPQAKDSNTTYDQEVVQ